MVPGNLKDVFWWWRGLSNQRLLNVAHSPCILDSFHPMDALGACLRFACTYWYLLRVADVALLHPFPEVCVEDIRELLLIPCWHYHVLWGDCFFSSFPNVTSHVSLFLDLCQVILQPGPDASTDIFIHSYLTDLRVHARDLARSLPQFLVYWEKEVQSWNLPSLPRHLEAAVDWLAAGWWHCIGTALPSEGLRHLLTCQRFPISFMEYLWRLHGRSDQTEQILSCFVYGEGSCSFPDVQRFFLESSLHRSFWFSSTVSCMHFCFGF